MLRATVLLVLMATSAAALAVEPFPKDFKEQDIAIAGEKIHVRVGGHGPAVLLLHGFGDTGDMWAPLAKDLNTERTMVVPDLRGMGLSSHPETGYEKKAQAQDLARLLDALHIKQVQLVTHDIGNMVGYAFAAQFPERVTRFAIIDAPLPGIGNWDETRLSPKTWHFNFRGPDVERLVAGRERILLDRFYNELSATPASIDEATRDHYAKLYAQPLAMHSAFNQFAAFAQDAIDNPKFAAHAKLPMPVLAIGGDHSYGAGMGKLMQLVATDVTSLVIQNSGHWIMEEQPKELVRAIGTFLRK
jgi:pimeloyl-ACP methyl ester carboxylesterase